MVPSVLGSKMAKNKSHQVSGPIEVTENTTTNKLIELFLLLVRNGPSENTKKS